MNNYEFSLYDRQEDNLLATIPVLSRPTLRLGSQGEYVELLQMGLKHLMFYEGNVDGIFDNSTLSSVKSFQTNNRLLADGIVGKDTWSALIDLYTPLATCEGVSHIVQRGDTLWSIAKNYNTTVDELIRINNLKSNLLTVGQELIIPSSVQESEESTTYTVQRGDSLWVIAQRFNTTVDEIKRLNNLTSNLLRIGQKLIIPSSVQEPEESTTYTVQRGDSLWVIAQRFNTTVDEIKRLNNLTSNLLSIGQTLKIPK